MKHLRKRKYIDSSVQGGIVARLVGYWLGTIALCVVLAMVLGWFADPLAPFDQQLDRQMRFVWPMLLASGLVLPAGILHLIRYTHRFAGPIARLRTALNDLADGKPIEELRFREKDYWLDLADAFNRVRALQATTTPIRKATLALDAEAAQLAAREELQHA
jgi:hypothetical protein